MSSSSLYSRFAHFFRGFENFNLLNFSHLYDPYRFMGKLTVEVPPRCQVPEGNAVKLQHHYLSGD